jgi:hypothetical protein
LSDELLQQSGKAAGLSEELEKLVRSKFGVAQNLP